MTAMEMIQAISNGNPGTIAVLAGILKDYKKIDPENSMGIFGYLAILDTFKIYDGSLWGIHSKISEMSVLKTIAILRGLQLGILSIQKVNKYLKGGIDTPDFFALITEIRSKIKNFAPDFEM
jgi:hypothetical protein